MRVFRSLFRTALVVVATVGGSVTIAAAQQPVPPASPPESTAPLPAPPPATGQTQAPSPPPRPPANPVPFEPVLMDPPAAPAEPVPPPPPVPSTPVAPMPPPPPPPPPAATVPSGQPLPSGEATVGVGAPAQNLPPPRSDQDPLPPVPAPALATTGVTQQAGIGGTQAYGRSGVLEMGGAAGFGAASNYTRIDVSPSIGLFVLDNFQLSLLTGFSYFRVGATDMGEGERDRAQGDLRAQPAPAVLAGVVRLPRPWRRGRTISGHKAGIALQPRLGANFLIGRSGIFTPAAYFSYSTVEAIQTEAGAILALRSSYGNDGLHGHVVAGGAAALQAFFQRTRR